MSHDPNKNKRIKPPPYILCFNFGSSKHEESSGYNYEIRLLLLVHFIWGLFPILTGILFVHTWTYVEPDGLNCDIFFTPWNQIRMY